VRLRPPPGNRPNPTSLAGARGSGGAASSSQVVVGAHPVAPAEHARHMHVCVAARSISIVGIGFGAPPSLRPAPLLSTLAGLASIPWPAKGAVRCDPPAAPLPRQRNKRFEDRPDPHVKRNLLARGAPWIEPTQPVRSCTRTHAHRRFQDQ